MCVVTPNYSIYTPAKLNDMYLKKKNHICKINTNYVLYLHLIGIIIQLQDLEIDQLSK